MLGSGRLELIQDAELRSALAEWEGVLADVTEDERDARDVMIRDLGPVLRRRVDMRPFQRYEHHLGTLSLAEAGATSRLPVDLEIIGVFASQQFWLRHVIQEFEGPEAEAQRMLALIDRSLE